MHVTPRRRARTGLIFLLLSLGLPGVRGDHPPPEKARLSWFTSTAEALGLDSLFGAAAEAVLLGVLVAVLVAATLVALRLARASPGPATEPVEEPVDTGPMEVVAPRQPIGGLGYLLVDSIQHVPASPRAGQQVRSALVIANEGIEGARLHARLLVDGRTMLEKTIAVPGHQRVKISFPWQAGPGPNEATVDVALK